MWKYLKCETEYNTHPATQKVRINAAGKLLQRRTFVRGRLVKDELYSVKAKQGWRKLTETLYDHMVVCVERRGQLDPDGDAYFAAVDYEERNKR